ncbi:MAG TPA: Fe-S-binding domain-containing protein [Blastocatellia bacterium]|jgi:NADH-quinone oxidoreductase subunit M|nr:Fe-S-binding domain-containing protein [Blastocatellia bacterium]HAF23907.1 Fe-S-binding domain-containing protein [Blastocatellia bacterium]HCX28485.1 Fe-S-binding domain-containing protein [Blastocatellia bacterium]
MQQHLLTTIIILPVFGALATVAYSLLPSKRESNYKWIALFFSVLDFALSLLLVRGVEAGAKDFRFVEDVLWIGSIGAHYHLGVDGISLWLVLLTTLLMPIAILSSWTAIQKRQLSYYVFLLLLAGAMIGVFVSLDLLLFYLFFEASLVPMFFLIGIWGGDRRIYAAVKFFIYTAVGSLLMLVGIIALYYIYATQTHGAGTFDYVTIMDALKQGRITLNDSSGQATTTQFWLFLAFALAFCIKVPLFPFHTWLPDAHTEAPTAGSVILAGVLLKMGTYGLLRFNLGLFPEVSRKFAPVVITLAIIGIIYGALVAMVQPDVKRLVAYSSVSHMGFVVLGLFSFTEMGMQGALYQMLSHGVSTGALFLFVGFIYERRHTRMISEFGGLATPMPWFSTLFVIASLSSIGLPFLNGFVGEFLIMIGSWTSNAIQHAWIATMLASTGVIWAAVYMLWMLQRVVFGKVTNPENAKLRDLNAREIGLLIPLLGLMLFMGVYPRVFLDRSQASVEEVRSRVAAPPAGGSFASLKPGGGGTGVVAGR